MMFGEVDGVVFEEDMPYLIHQTHLKRNLRSFVEPGKRIRRDVPDLVAQLTEAFLACAIEKAVRGRSERVLTGAQLGRLQPWNT